MTTFDLYVEGIEARRQKALNERMNEEIAARMRSRTEEEAYEALLSLSLFSAVKKTAAGQELPA